MFIRLATGVRKRMLCPPYSSNIGTPSCQVKKIPSYTLKCITFNEKANCKVYPRVQSSARQHAARVQRGSRVHGQSKEISSGPSTSILHLGDYLPI